MDHLQANIDHIDSLRDRLRQSIQAVNSHQFSAAPPEQNNSVEQDAKDRSQKMGNLIDETFSLLRSQALGDIHAASDRLERMRQYQADIGQPKKSVVEDDIIDVEAKVVPEKND
jgi:hypothetical protein